jgi:prepilin-type N-terminal cleavage/methylation domain-containing protein
MKAIGRFARIRERSQFGFSLLELMIAIVVLAVVVAVIVSGVTQLQKTNTAQAVNVDLTQESRQFMDQVVEDLHQAGFPPVAMFDNATTNPNLSITSPGYNPLLAVPNPLFNPNLYAVGLVSVTSTSIQYEGDVDGTGVSEVSVQISPAGGPCPCKLLRGAVSKVLFAGGKLPTYYTEVDGVNNLNIFTAYDKFGNVVALPCGTVTAGVCADGSSITNIKDIGMLLNVQSNVPNPITHTYTNVTMSTEAKLQ